MGNSKNYSGSCLCGAVSVSMDLEKTDFDVCHCGMCRKWGGGPLLSIDMGKKGADFYNFPVGLFDGNEEFKFHQQIFIDHKPGNYDFANKTEMMTEAQILAKHGPPPK